MKAHKVVFYCCLAVSVILLTGGALTPPPFVIDGSIFTACGILFAYATLAQVSSLIRLGKEVRIKHKDTEVTLGDDDKGS